MKVCWITMARLGTFALRQDMSGNCGQSVIWQLCNPAESGHSFRTIPDTVPVQSGQASG
jgi:hypothetical protein